MYYFREARTAEEYRKLHRLRYRSYCVEKSWICRDNHPDGLEKDEYDASSTHFIAVDTKGEVVGTLRLVLFDKQHCTQSLPITKHPHIFENSLVLNNCAEVSRLVVDKKARPADISLGLYRIMYQYSRDRAIDTWYIVVDTIYLKVLQKLGFPFEAIGKAGKYMGVTIPAKLKLETVEQHLRERNRPLYRWFQSPPHTIEEPVLHEVSHFSHRRPFDSRQVRLIGSSEHYQQYEEFWRAMRRRKKILSNFPKPPHKNPS